MSYDIIKTVIENGCEFLVEDLVPLEVTLNVILLGPYENGVMGTTLNSSSLLPNSQPYNVSPYNYSGTESVVSFDPEVVDWILVSVRSNSDLNTVLAYKALLLRSDGTVTDTNGNTNFVLATASAGTYKIAVHHRNHLDIVTDSGIVFDGSGIVNLNFTAGTLSSVMKETSSGSGIFGMYKGDVNKDHRVINDNVPNPDEDSDRYRILEIVGILTPNNIVVGYNAGDVNMDGLVKYNGPNNDKNEVLESVGILTPTNIIIGQFYGI